MQQVAFIWALPEILYSPFHCRVTRIKGFLWSTGALQHQKVFQTLKVEWQLTWPCPPWWFGWWCEGAELLWSIEERSLSTHTPLVMPDMTSNTLLHTLAHEGSRQAASSDWSTRFALLTKTKTRITKALKSTSPTQLIYYMLALQMSPRINRTSFPMIQLTHPLFSFITCLWYNLWVNFFFFDILRKNL